ncbi:MAG: response regulator [Bacteroidales bacterium]
MEFYKSVNKIEQLSDISGEKRILIVEDDDIGFSLLEEIFIDYNIDIERACDGTEAISFFTEDKYAFDLVLMDIRMPNVNGFEATSKIKELNPTVPIIAVTAYVHSQSIFDCQNCGCDEFIAKPFEINHLVKLVSRYLKIRK